VADGLVILSVGEAVCRDCDEVRETCR